MTVTGSGLGGTAAGEGHVLKGGAAGARAATPRARPTPRLLVARGLWVAIVAVSLTELAMIAATLRASAPDQWGFRGNEAVLALAWGSIGGLIAARQPANRIGWLLLSLSLISAVQGIVDQYPALAASLGLGGDQWARWVSAWIWVIPSTGFLAFVPLLFPDGRLPSRRWRGAVVLGCGAMTVLAGTIVLSIRPLGPLEPSADVTPALGAFGATNAIAYGLYLAAAVTGVGATVVRYRQASGDERQQLKWVAYALVLVMLGAVAGASPILAGQLLFLATVLLTAVAVGIAMLRYRLYEIDVIINRTLVYGALSAILAGTYTASISLSQRLFMAITGERSDAAVVLTTLVLVATFTPLNARLQTIVDRRVNPVPAPAGTGPAAPATGDLLRAAEGRLRQIAREEIAQASERAAISRTERAARGGARLDRC